MGKDGESRSSTELEELKGWEKGRKQRLGRVRGRMKGGKEKLRKMKGEGDKR